MFYQLKCLPFRFVWIWPGTISLIFSRFVSFRATPKIYLHCAFKFECALWLDICKRNCNQWLRRSVRVLLEMLCLGRKNFPRGFSETQKRMGKIKVLLSPSRILYQLATFGQRITNASSKITIKALKHVKRHQWQSNTSCLSFLSFSFAEFRLIPWHFQVLQVRINKVNEQLARPIKMSQSKI